MVNRRLLRTKAFQNLYALRTAERADYQHYHDIIAESFLPNLDLMIPKEEQIVKLDMLRKLSEIHYEEVFHKKDANEDIPAESKVAAKKSLLMYRDAVKRDRNRITNRMVSEVENIYNVYLKMLQLLLKITEIAVWDEKRR